MTIAFVLGRFVCAIWKNCFRFEGRLEYNQFDYYIIFDLLYLTFFVKQWDARGTDQAQNVKLSWEYALVHFFNYEGRG